MVIGKERVFQRAKILRFKSLAPAAILVLVYCSAAILLRPFVDLPFHDDWTYAWSVEHLLKTGELRILDWSVHYPVTQILWGTLFCLPLGFSFTALKSSTVVLAWLGALAVYGTLRELGHRRSESLIATLVLIANPVFFVLTFSFMTDIPFVSVSNIAFLFIVRGIRRKHSLQLWVGCALAASAFFIRQIAIAIPVSLILYVLFTPSYRTWKYILPPLTVSMFLGVMPFLIGQLFGLTTQYAGRTWVLDYWLSHYDQSVSGVLRIFVHIGFALIPVTITLVLWFHRRPLFRSSLGAILLFAGCAFLYSGDIPHPLEGMWRLDTLGNERHLLHGIPDRDFLPSWWNYPLFVVSLFSFAAVITKVFEVIRTDTSRPFGLFGWHAFSHFALIMVLALFGGGSDRYSIVLLPPLILLATSGHLRAKTVLLSVVIFYSMAMLVTWNETQTSRAIADAVAWLRQKNIALADIDAGYVFNGWNLYAHPENLPPGAVPERDVPFVTSKENKPYVIAASPIAGYRVVREYSWSIPARSLIYKIYVLEQLPDRANRRD